MGRVDTRRQIWAMRRTDGPFAAWPHKCAQHENFYRLSVKARALLLEFLGQLRGHNNGDLTCAYKVLRKRGWNSRTTIEAARAELEAVGWIVKTRTGSRNRCNLYALTMFAIDECDGKLEIPGTVRPLDFWKLGENPYLKGELLPKLPPLAFSKTNRRPTPSTAGPNGGRREETSSSDVDHKPAT